MKTLGLRGWKRVTWWGLIALATGLVTYELAGRMRANPVADERTKWVGEWEFDEPRTIELELARQVRVLDIENADRITDLRSAATRAVKAKGVASSLSVQASGDCRMRIETAVAGGRGKYDYVGTWFLEDQNLVISWSTEDRGLGPVPCAIEVKYSRDDDSIWPTSAKEASGAVHELWGFRIVQTRVQGP